MPKSERMTNDETRRLRLCSGPSRFDFRHSGFGFLSDFVIRISDFASRLPLGLPQPGDPVARFPLTPFLEQLQPLKAFEHVPFTPQSRRRAQTTML